MKSAILAAALLAVPLSVALAQQPPASQSTDSSRATADTARTRELVFSETVGGGPSYVTLDSGVVYRVVANGAAIITPRQQYRAPAFRFAGPQPGPFGAPYVPSFTGEYRLDATGSGASVQIYREAVDQRSAACVADPKAAGCIGATPGRRKYGLLVAMLAAPIAAYMFFAK